MPWKDKEYQKKYFQQYWQNRKDFVNKAKSKPCADCGIQYDPWVMDFDHVRGEKILAVNILRSHRSIEKIQEEIDKCDVVCANCHRQRAYKRAHDGMVDKEDLKSSAL